MNPASKIQKLLHEAVAHHQAGRLSAAEALYAKVIKIDPRNADALHLMGVIAHSRDEVAKAKKYFEHALESAPNVPDIWLNFGNLLAAMDDLEGAQAAYGRAIALKPAFFDAQLGLGGIFFKRGRFEDAVGCFRNAIALSPQDPRAHFNLGQSQLRLARRDEAETSLLRAIDLSPVYLEAHVALGDLYAEAGRIQDAIFHSRRAVELKPTPEFYSSLGELYRQAQDVESALAAHRVAVAARPDDPVIQHNFAAALHAADQFDEAERVLTHTVGKEPNFVTGYVGLAKVFEFQGRFEQAIAMLEHALRLDPNATDILFKLALRHLMAGVFADGWKEYESRFLTADKRQVKFSPPPPYWDGEDLSGKTILIWTEQGLGDEILYGSMIPDVLARAKNCIIQCSQRMVPVFARSFPRATVFSHQDQHARTQSSAAADFQTAIASLGQFLRQDIASFPVQHGYLQADASRAAALRARYRAVTPGNLVVGISWRSRNEDIGVIKNTDLSAWGDILRVPGVTFVNLQYGDCAAELAAVKQDVGVEVFQDAEVNALESMDDFFAQVAAMDLVVSTSNTTVHVAGSLDVPTWLLLSGRPGALWYWFHDRADSPWYPSLKVIRGTPQYLVKHKELWWSEIISRAAAELKTFIEKPDESHGRRGVQPEALG